MKTKMVWRFAACVVLAACASVYGQTTATAPAVKAAPPTLAEQKEILTSINEVYKAAIAAAKSGTQKSEVGMKMFEAAKGEKGIAKYALLNRAKDLLAEGANVQGTFSAIDELASLYEVKGYKLKADAAALITKNAWHSEQRWRVVMTMPGAISEAIMAEDFEVARQLAAAELSAAQRTQDADAIKEASARTAQIRDAENISTEAKKAAAAYEKSPEDAAANLTLGKYFCFYMGNWNVGLPMLAKGGDAALKAAAELEKGTDKLSLADKWWEIAATYTGVAKANIQNRAAKMYAENLENIPPGLMRSRIETRLDEMKKIAGRPAGELPWEKPFIGDYQIGANALVISADHTAKNTWAPASGTWTYVEGTVHIRWENGWMDVIYVQGNSITNVGFRPGQAVTETPFGKGVGVRKRKVE